ncbi:MAG: hypothetical protein P1U69_02240 [Parvibaculaceae bacterium]|nr:hypothetical protein [Parvibaculaceae bacterium]HBM89370.1 hypothetical protein [Rhodobiaceae bacterium]
MPKTQINSVLNGEYTREHCVPTSELLPLVRGALKIGDHACVEELVAECCRVAYITKRENDALDEANLNASIPTGWTDDLKKAYLARYSHEAVNIHLEETWPENCTPDFGGRGAEMKYARLKKWTSADAADEIIKLWNAGLREPLIPISAILVGYSHTNHLMSKECRLLWDAAPK